MDDLAGQVGWFHKRSQMLQNWRDTRMTVGGLFAPGDPVGPRERVASRTKKCWSGDVSHGIVKGAARSNYVTPTVRTMDALDECPGLPTFGDPVSFGRPHWPRQPKSSLLDLEVQLSHPACFHCASARFQHDISTPERLALSARQGNRLLLTAKRRLNAGGRRLAHCCYPSVVDRGSAVIARPSIVAVAPSISIFPSRFRHSRPRLISLDSGILVAWQNLQHHPHS